MKMFIQFIPKIRFFLNGLFLAILFAGLIPFPLMALEVSQERNCEGLVTSFVVNGNYVAVRFFGHPAGTSIPDGPYQCIIYTNLNPEDKDRGGINSLDTIKMGMINGSVLSDKTARIKTDYCESGVPDTGFIFGQTFCGRVITLISTPTKP